MKQNKTVFNGPIIRYHSVTMPKLEEEDDDDNNDHEEVNTSNQKISDLSKQQSDKKSRNFIIFSSEQTVKEIFSSSEQIKPKPKKCVITGLQAKYLDPLTKCPYNNLYAFKKIRELYAAKKNVNTNNE